MVDHYAWHHEFVGDLARTTGENRKIILFFFQIVKIKDH